MFEFLEDNYLLEWWDEEFKAWWAAMLSGAVHRCTCLPSLPSR
jgi:hypothetical protein